MSSKQLKDYSDFQITEVREFTKKSHSLDLEERGKNLYVRLRLNVTNNEVLELLDFLWKNQFEVQFHDLIYPSYTDPGAYFSYSYQKASHSNVWSMTYGNHGWSGGIYHITKTTLAQQIVNLVQKSGIERIQITGVIFFDHYPLEGEQESAKKDQEIYAVHVD